MRNFHAALKISRGLKNNPFFLPKMKEKKQWIGA